MAKTLKSFIKSVSFRSNVEVEKYRHVHVEAAADVAKGDRPEDVIAMLKAFATQELNRAKGAPLIKFTTIREMLSTLRSADAGYNNITVEHPDGGMVELDEYLDELEKELTPKASTFRPRTRTTR